MKATSIVVLLSLAPALTLIIATNLMGTKSKLYAYMSSTPVEFEAIESKMAIETIVAVAAFNQFKKEGARGELDQERIAQALQDAGIDEDGSKIIASAAAAKQAATKELLPGDEGTAPFVDFVNQFATDGITVEDLTSPPQVKEQTIFTKITKRLQVGANDASIAPMAAPPSSAAPKAAPPSSAAPKNAKNVLVDIPVPGSAAMVGGPILFKLPGSEVTHKITIPPGLAEGASFRVTLPAEED